MEGEGNVYRNELIDDVGHCVKLGAQEREEDARNRRRSRCCTGERRDDESHRHDDDSQPLYRRNVGLQEDSGVQSAEHGNGTERHLKQPTSTVHHSSAKRWKRKETQLCELHIRKYRITQRRDRED